MTGPPRAPGSGARGRKSPSGLQRGRPPVGRGARVESAAAPAAKVSPKPTKGIKYRLKEIPGKGIGLIATRRIRRKEVFLTDLPSLFIDSRLETLADQAVADFEEDRKALYNFGVESLGGKDRVLALSGSRSSFEGIDNIFKSNSFLVATDEGNHNGLFPEVARINHDCEPKYRMGPPNRPPRLPNRPNLRLQVPMRPLQPPLRGEPPRDGRLRRMQEIEGLLKSGDQSYEAASDMARELIRLATEERLEGKMQEIYLDLMGVFYDFADYGNALYFAETALGYAEEFEEPEGATITGIRTNINVLRGLVAQG
ncbi:unnamed protein product [Parascedosporium putredinis]|uniref:Uncharacterized protein n=1 Tax=Parascedosporium putredinis TaxID=1442378 RepID=A0A9P1GWM6_9PEZI|nr:unnamed protein product [Parascedosporium putredinis]CAI7988427.1 unnamed protein product [Parascedosporium putredinis]